jgi:hypothetical protein
MVTSLKTESTYTYNFPCYFLVITCLIVGRFVADVIFNMIQGIILYKLRGDFQSMCKSREKN